jgi:hypothetical protein
VRDLDLGPLRDIWLQAGDLGQLLRDPRQSAPLSLLQGDERMLTGTTSSGRGRRRSENGQIGPPLNSSGVRRV